ncbi:MAG TPA: OsmC family protein [Vicinamibacterales bacterium]|nr:OsmC family protein [Vicinamibacterales bacterium]
MSASAPIKDALERSMKLIEANPSMGQGTAVTKVTLSPGLACEVEDGPWRFSGGMTEKYGGQNTGPNPGVYGRAALGTCLAIGYGMWAAKLEIPIRSLTVEVRARYDVRGEFGIDDSIRPGYLAIVYVVTVDTDASDADVQRWLDAADAHSSLLDDFRNPVPVTREVNIVRNQTA